MPRPRAGSGSGRNSRQSVSRMVLGLALLVGAADAPAHATTAAHTPEQGEAIDRVSSATDSLAPLDTTSLSSPDTTNFARSDTSEFLPSDTSSTTTSADTAEVAASDSVSIIGVPVPEPRTPLGPLSPQPGSPSIPLSPGQGGAPTIGSSILASTPRGPDTMRLRFELGASSDFTNEQFYEDAFIDTVALGRRLVGDPESQVAAVFGAIFRRHAIAPSDRDSSAERAQPRRQAAARRVPCRMAKPGARGLAVD